MIFLKYFRVLAIFSLYGFVQAANNNTNDVRDLDLVDILMLDLENEDWSSDEDCWNATRTMLQAAKDQEIWAVWMLESMQQPTGALSGSRYHLGSFEQCVGERWPTLATQYCLVDLHLADHAQPFSEEFDPRSHIDQFVRTKTKYNRRIHINSIGVCAPSVCSESSVLRLARRLALASSLQPGTISLRPGYCQRHEDSLRKSYSLGFYIFWFLLCALVTVALTVYILEDTVTDPIALKVVDWFSPTKNFEALTKLGRDELKSLNGIRALSAGTITVLHYFYYVNKMPIINQSAASEFIDEEYGKYLIHLDLIVDTFFLMSGLLYMKGLCCNKSSIMKMVFKRYVRLLPIYAVVMLYMVYVSQFSGSGPLWPKYIEDQQQPCVRNWWVGALMLQNIYRTDDMCYLVTWYLSCDFQLAVLAAIIFYLWKKHNVNGKTIFGVLLFLSMLIPGILTYLYSTHLIVIHDFDMALDVKDNRTMQHVYFNFYCRFCAYVIGAALGYIMNMYRPENNKKKFSKTLSVFSCFCGVSLMLMGLRMGGVMMFKEYDALKTVLFSTIDKFIWSIGVCLVIVMCEYGDLPIVGGFLTSKVFVPLSRLSFGLYMYHPLVMFKTLYHLRAPVTFELIHMIINGLGYVVISYVVSYLLWFLIDAPSNNIINYLFKNRKPAAMTLQTQQHDSPTIECNDSLKNK